MALNRKEVDLNAFNFLSADLLAFDSFAIGESVYMFVYFILY